MNNIRTTLSLCNHCFKHIPAFTYDKNNEIFLEKNCSEHGTMIQKIESDSDFYYNYKYEKLTAKSYFLDVTRKCNLKCTHCYQVPYNFDIEKPIDYFIKKIRSWETPWRSIALAGAEAFMRKDFFELHDEIKKELNENQKLVIATNGVMLSKKEFSKKLSDYKNTFVTISLHHHSYHDNKIREKQLKGIDNCKNFGLQIHGISYTLNSFFELKDILKEMKVLKDFCQYFTISLGFQTGLFPDSKRLFLSDLVKYVSKICQKLNYSFKIDLTKSNRTHCVVFVDDIEIKLLQLTDVYTIDLGEINTTIIGDLLEDKPPSQAIHQIILRDAYINKGIPLEDTIPEEWGIHKFKKNWRFDFTRCV